MIKKKSDKKIPSLKPDFQNILICKKKENSPFMGILIENPENISRKNLGVLVGIFQITDYSEDSSYIVNYLISVIKKEYFSKTNRGPIENFEAALHKANIALSELARHKAIDWVGRINAICAVIEKNNILLSQTGSAGAFLLRKNSLIEITENLSEQAEINPLKTFQDVISGKIEANDKLIFTTEEIFELFSLEDIKKNASKFSRENFIQFLNTALINELDQVVTLVIDILEQPETNLPDVSFAQKIPTFNAFSQASFKVSKKLPHSQKKILTEKSSKKVEISEKKIDFTDQKTGHIYLKEDAILLEEAVRQKTSTFNFSQTSKKITTFLITIKKITHKLFSALKKYLQITLYKVKKKKEKTSDELEEMVRATLKKETENEKKQPIVPKKTFSSQALEFYQTYIPKIKILFANLWEKIVSLCILVLRIPFKGILKIRAFIKKRQRQIEKNETKQLSNGEKKIEHFFSTKRNQIFIDKQEKQNAWNTKLKNILPDFSKLKISLQKFTTKQKISAFLILFFLLIFPYWIAKWQNKATEKKTIPPIETPLAVLPLEKDTNIVRITDLKETYSENIQKILTLNGHLFAVNTDNIVDIENQKSTPIPNDFQTPDFFFEMNDLNLIFLIKNNQITSFAPATEKFATNNLVFPENAKITDAKTYLTYLYLLDENNKQIYRYPRIEGGFGDKVAWIKDSLGLSNATSFAINENIFIIDNNTIIKLFHGKKIAFTIEETATPIMPNKLYTKRDMSNIYLLDKANSRIIKIDTDGKILAQYYNEKIALANDFSVNEENHLIYIADQPKIHSFIMP